jgi:hypothetical protein
MAGGHLLSEAGILPCGRLPRLEKPVRDTPVHIPGQHYAAEERASPTYSSEEQSLPQAPVE